MSKLTDYRKEIDLIDEDIIQLLDKRYQLSLKVKEYKQEKGIEVLDSKREEFIKNKILSYRGSEVIKEQILGVYNTILKSSKDLQK